jgi:hypothetical protein
VAGKKAAAALDLGLATPTLMPTAQAGGLFSRFAGRPSRKTAHLLRKIAALTIV